MFVAVGKSRPNVFAKSSPGCPKRVKDSRDPQSSIKFGPHQQKKSGMPPVTEVDDDFRPTVRVPDWAAANLGDAVFQIHASAARAGALDIFKKKRGD